MNQWLELHTITGKSAWLNLANARSMTREVTYDLYGEPEDEFTFIVFGPDHEARVKETPERIAAMLRDHEAPLRDLSSAVQYMVPA